MSALLRRSVDPRLRTGSWICLLFIFTFGSFCAPARAEEISRTPPQLFQERLKPLLTPLAQARIAAEGLDATDCSGLVVLTERIQFVHEDGRKLVALQVAYKTLTEAGVSTNSDDVFTFRRNQQKFHLIAAETIQPDGSVLPVKPDAILVQTPQRQADYSLYNDMAEVRIIFPKVKPGSITHTIAVIEDLQARMPGEFSYTHTWDAGWPIGRLRQIVDLPQSLAARLGIFKLGANTPDPTRELLEGDRVRLTWARDRIPTQRAEVEAAPASQTGPCVHLSTIASWDRIGTWFAGMLKDRDQLSPALTANVDEWTKSARTPDEILRVLLTKVADDVRYVGLELGQADYQPHHANDVWENQYGDCKDKANLLVAMLRHKNIPAWLVLLNTNHLGLVDRRAPDYLIFNHAIAAVAGTKGGIQFCDPTIPHTRPGLLGPGSTDREVLVIKDGGAEWAHTPATTAGSTRYEFDLKLNATGEISGWLTLRADGYCGVSQRERFEQLEPDERRRKMAKVLRGFYPGAEVVDVALDPIDPATDVAVAKAYFIVPGQSEAQIGQQTLMFPRSSALFPDLGQSPQRNSIYHVFQDRTVVSCSIALPPGFTASTWPENFRVETPTWSNRAQWRFEKDTARMELDMAIAQPALTPKEFTQFYQAMQSFRAWLAKSVVIAAGAAAPKIGADDPVLNLPLMATAAGQLDLVNKRFPEEGNHALRRAALEKTLRCFPDDKATAFDVGVHLAILDWRDDKNQEAFDRLQNLLRDNKATVTPDTFAWAEHVQALTLRDLKRKLEAAAILTRLVHDTGLSAERRAMAARDVAWIRRPDSPSTALALIREVSGLKSTQSPTIFCWLSALSLQLNQAADLRRSLQEVARTRPEELDGILTAIVKDATAWSAPGDEERQQTMFALAQELAPQPSEELRAALTSGQLRLACVKIQLRLKAALAQKPYSDWYRPATDEKLKTLEDFNKANKKAEEKVDPEQCLQLQVQSLVTLPIDDNFPARLWEAPNDADWCERRADQTLDLPIFDLLLDLCDALPPDHTYRSEGQILRAKRLARGGDARSEQSLYESMLKSPSLGKNFVAPVARNLGLSYEKAGDFSHALETYRHSEPHVVDYFAATAALLRAVLINLHQGHQDEALRLIGLLEQAKEETLKKSTGEVQIRELIALRKSGQAQAFWTASASWWPAWRKLAKSLGSDEEGNDLVVPVIPDLDALDKRVAQAVKDNQAQRFLASCDQLASAARWFPSLAEQLAAHATAHHQLFPSQELELGRILIAVLAVPHPTGLPGLRGRQLRLAAFYIDDKQPEEALRVVTQFNLAEQPADWTRQMMRRIWALAILATRQDDPACVAALEKDLTDTGLTNQRAWSVSLLADLYRARARGTDEEALLKRELLHPSIVADKESLGALTTRYELLTGGKRLAATATAWLKAFPIEWYEFAEPSSLDDPRLRNLPAVLKSPDKQFALPEQVKLQLLVTQDPHGTLEQQSAAWQEACRLLFLLARTNDEVRSLTASIIDNPAIDDDIRLRVLWRALISAAAQARNEDYAGLRHHPLTEKFNARYRKQMEAADLAVATDRSSVKSIAKLTHALGERELDFTEVSILEDSLDDLLRLGDLGAAKALSEEVPSWIFHADLSGSKESMQFDFAKRIRNAERWLGTHEALIREVLARYPDLPEREPADYAPLRHRDTPQILARDITLLACLHRIRTRDFDQEDLGFWSTFIDSLPTTPEDEQLIGNLARIAITTAQDDDQRAEAVQAITSAADIDNPRLRQQIETVLAPYHTPEDAPLTYAQIRIFEIQVSLRTGKPVDLATAYEGLSSANVAFERTRNTLRHHLQTRDRASLKRFINDCDSALLLSPGMLTVSLPALELVGLTAEAKTARQLARRELKRALLNSWSTGGEFATGHALALAETLGDADALPKAWIQTVATRAGNPWNREHVPMIDAWLRKDWEEVRRHAAELIRIRPTYYHTYWYLGSALHRLGRDAEATDPLGVFVRYAHDDEEYPEAEALLRTLRPGTPQENCPPQAIGSASPR